MQFIEVPNGISSAAVGTIFLLLFLGILIYLLATTYIDKEDEKKLQKAQKLIEEGHKRALHGTKNDGLYKEIKIKREEEEWKIKEQTKKDFQKLH